MYFADHVLLYKHFSWYIDILKEFIQTIEKVSRIFESENVNYNY